MFKMKLLGTLPLATLLDTVYITTQVSKSDFQLAKYRVASVRHMVKSGCK